MATSKPKVTAASHQRLEVGKDFGEALLERFRPDYMMIGDTHSKWSLTSSIDK